MRKFKKKMEAVNFVNLLNYQKNGEEKKKKV